MKDKKYFANINTDSNQTAIGSVDGMNAAELMEAVEAHRASDQKHLPIEVSDETGKTIINEDN